MSRSATKGVSEQNSLAWQDCAFFCFSEMLSLPRHRVALILSTPAPQPRGSILLGFIHVTESKL